VLSTERDVTDDWEPELTITPPTRIVAYASDAVGVNLMLVCKLVKAK